MRKILVFTLLFCVALSLFGCMSAKSPLDSLPKYENKVLYSNGTYQRFADYAIYEYKSVESSYFEDNKFFSPVKSNDIEEIKEFLEDFAVFDSKPDQYDFDVSALNEGDYFYIETLEDSDLYEKYDNYTIYIFDSETNILYYLHKNI